jgi:hypothetical protein
MKKGVAGLRLMGFALSSHLVTFALSEALRAQALAFKVRNSVSHASFWPSLISGRIKWSNHRVSLAVSRNFSQL